MTGPSSRIPLPREDRGDFAYFFRKTPSASAVRSDAIDEPITCQFGHLLQCTELLKQVRCAGNNLQLHVATHLVARHFVQRDDNVIVAADDEQCRRLNFWQTIAS